MKRYEYVENEASFEADWGDRQLYVPDAIENLHISVKADASAAGAKTMAELMPLLNMLELKHGGNPVARLTGKELFAFSALYMGKVPSGFDCDAVIDETVMINDMVLPVRLAAGPGPFYYSADRTAQAGLDTEKLTIIKEVIEEGPTGPPLKIMPFSYTPSATGTELKALEWVPAGDLQAIMVWMTTALKEDVAAATLKEFMLYDGGVLKHRTNLYHLYRALRYYGQLNDAAVDKLLPEFLLWDFRPNPIPAGSSLRLDVVAGAMDATKIWPIENIP